jgi:hypothetical protein
MFNTATASILQISTETNGLTPGKTGVITLSFTNTGADTSHDVKAVLKSIDSPLTSDSTCNKCILYSSTQRVCLDYADYCYTRVGDIKGINGQEAVFRINIPENTESGVYVADFDIIYGSKNVTTNEVSERLLNKKVVINIESTASKPVINIKTVSASQIISPGEEFNLTITIENKGLVKALNTEVELNSVFKVKDKTNKELIGNLMPGSEHTINYSLISDRTITPGVHEAVFTINYSDETSDYTSTSSTGIIVDGEARFNVFIQDITPNIITNETIINTLISVANTGVINAQSVSIKLKPSDYFDEGNINEDYLGDLDSGDFTSTSFKIKPLSEGELNIELIISYTTPTGQRVDYNTTQKMIIRFSKQETINNNINVLAIILTLTIVVLITRLVNKRKNKK